MSAARVLIPTLAIATGAGALYFLSRRRKMELEVEAKIGPPAEPAAETKAKERAPRMTEARQQADEELAAE
jgi:hypothetical protein